MAKQVEQKQNAWYGGISDDPRQSTGDAFIITKHFDIFSQPNRLTPYRSFEADTHDGSTSTGMKQYLVRDFLWASSSAKLYGLGQTAGGLTKIVYKADATTGNWTLPANSEGTGAVRNGCLVEYKDYLWGFQGNTNVFKWGTLSGVPTITDSAGTVGTVRATVTAVAVNAAGTGYQVNDILTLSGGSGTAKCIVNTLTGAPGSGVATVTLTEPGYNYTTGSAATTVSPSGGSGCTITISTVGDTSTNISSVAQGIIAKDDNLYLPYNNILVRVYPSGTVQDQALKLPTYLKITSLTNYGNYLAIGCAPVSTYNGVSKVFLWNLTSPDIQEVIDWGEGELRVLETIEGTIIGVTDRYLNNDSGAGRGSFIIQGYAGGYPQVLKEVFTLKLNGIAMPLSKAVKNNRLFFVSKIMTNAAGTEYNEGIWSFGRKNATYPYSLTLDYIDENVDTDGIQSFGAAGNFFFISHSGDGSIDKTNDAATYAFTSTYEPQVFDFGDIDNDKRLDSVKISFRKLATGESLTLKYKVDDATNWTTIGTFSTVGALSHTFVRDETNGTDFASGREFRFRVESTGGLEITGFKARATFFNVP
jgi:hypothetical protein